MGAARLVLDMGNTRLKACLFEGGAPSARYEDAGCVHHAEPLPVDPSVFDDRSVLADWHASLATPVTAIGLASVVEVEHTLALVTRLEEVLPASVVTNPDCGLVLEVTTPETTGRDRLYAARAAVEDAGEACVVVDAGTALTVDAVRPGVFLGGAIAPGPDLLARALSEGAAQLPAFTPKPGVHALGRSTLEALEAGVWVGFEGAVHELITRVAAEAGIGADAPVYLTGGHAPALFAALAGRGLELRPDPYLVLRGLATSLG